MNNFYFKKNKILYLLFGLIFTSTIENTFAEEIFNPAFLTDGHSSDIIISDLSISCFFHFIKEVNYIVKKYISIIYKITEKNNSPPKTIIK